jgi:hypothetical protein
MIEEKISLFNEGGLRDDGGETEPTSGNKVPSGSLKEEVADDIPVMMSEGEFVFPADVVRYIGLETLMKMRQSAKQGLKMMEEMGQMGNSEEATIPDDMPFEMADLIVVSGDGPKKMQSGGLLDDPRFQRPTGGGGDTPTITDEDKKEMEDALLRTGYGNVVMKRYVNADGEVKYIPFVNGEPQMEIPEGYELDESAPKTESNIGGSGDSGGGGDSGGPASPAPAFGDGMTFEKPRGPMVDGVEYENIQEMDAETLIKYYKQFDSPIYRYAATGAALFFSPLAGLAIMAGQTLSNKNSSTGLNAVQAELQKRKLTAEQKKSVLATAESLRKNGAGGIGSLGKKLLQGIGILSNTEQGEELTEFEKAIKSGNTAGAINAAGKAVGSNSNNQDLLIDASREGFQKYITEGGMGMDIDRRQPPAEPQPSGLPVELGEQASGFADPINPAVAGDPTLGLPAIDSTASGAFSPVDSGDPSVIFDEGAFINTPIVESQKVEAKKRLGDQGIDEKKLIEDQIDRSEESAPFRLPRSQFQPDYGFSRVDQIIDQQKRTKDRRTLGDKIFAPSEKKFGIETDPKITQTPAYTSGDDDRDGGGSSDSFSAIDDFFGGDFGQPSRPAPKTDTYADLTGNPFGDRGRTQTSSYSTDAGFGYGGSDVVTPFYVGGVPTKPMKPQRLKKGGLAKPKVKPKRMKKGGLASKK